MTATTAAARGRTAATTVLVLCAWLSLATLAGHALNADIRVDLRVPDLFKGYWLINASAALVFAVPGWYLATRRPEVPFGWLALAAGLGHGLAGVGMEWAVASELGGHDLPAAWFGAWLFGWGTVLELPVLAAAYALFPDGRLATGWQRRAALLAIALTCAGLALAVVDPYPIPGAADPAIADVRNPLGIGALKDLADAPETLFGPGMALATALVVLRWRRATGELRRTLSWLAALATMTLVIVPAVLFLPASIGFAVGQGTTLIEVTVITVAALRHHVYGIHVVLNRTLVYSGLTGMVAVIYGIAIAVGGLLGENGASSSSFAGALAASLLFAPARVRIQAAVNRFLYGDRDEPYAVVSRVASQLGAAGSAEQLLPAFAAATAQALQVPYVAVRLDGAEHSTTIAHGVPVDAVEELPLAHQGRTLGALLIGRRAGEMSIVEGERRLLEDLARQAAVAAANVVLTEDLRRSRERIVTAREEERRRLRHDLHDGLGPQLTGVALGLDVASERVAESFPALGADIERLRRELEEAIQDIRRLVNGLGPPRLDEVGLRTAIEEMAARASRGGLKVSVTATEPLPALRAAVEVAAFRIATEAITNVARHAGATTCVVVLAVEHDVLRLSVTDNGRGRNGSPDGVGTMSMRERVEEVGGSLGFENVHPSGCRVEAALPLDEPR